MTETATVSVLDTDALGLTPDQLEILAKLELDVRAAASAVVLDRLEDTAVRVSRAMAWCDQFRTYAMRILGTPRTKPVKFYSGDRGRREYRDSDGRDCHGADMAGYVVDARGSEYHVITHMTRDGYDRDGYDVDGFGRDGFGRSGYNREGLNAAGQTMYRFSPSGYDADGRDVGGFNTAGWDVNGYNRSGYNADGYDSEGFNPRGYDVDGYNRYGLNRNQITRDGLDRWGLSPFRFGPDGYDSDGHDRDGYNRNTGMYRPTLADQAREREREQS